MTRNAAIAVPGVSLTARVMDHVRSAVISGDMQPGRWYSVYQLADELGISRSPVRDGLLRLEEAGLIRFSRNRGFTVVPTTADDVAEIFSIRIALEVPSARRAARSPTRKGRQLFELHKAMADAAGNRDVERFFALDQDLHDAILEAAGVNRARDIVARLRVATRLVGASTIGQTGMRSYEDVMDEHRPIIDAIAEGRPADAGQAMRDHLVSTGRLLVAQTLVRAGGDEDADALWNRLTGGYA